MRVLVVPYLETSDNPYLASLVAGLRGEGLEVGGGLEIAGDLLLHRQRHGHHRR